MQNRFDSDALNWDANPTTQLLKQAIEKELDAHVQFNPNWHVLDYGSGTGNILLHVLPKVAHVTAMDNSMGMIEVLRSKIPLPYSNAVTTILHNADTDHLPLQTFDCILSSMTLHHIKDTQGFVSECFSALTQSGSLILIDLCKENGSFHKEIDATIYHFGFDMEYIQTLLQQTGFSNVSVHEFYAIFKDHAQQSFPVFFAIARK